jgi:hypothetical protein
MYNLLISKITNMKLNEKNETEYHKKIDILGAPCFKERKMRLYMESKIKVEWGHMPTI